VLETPFLSRILFDCSRRRTLNLRDTTSAIVLQSTEGFDGLADCQPFLAVEPVDAIDPRRLALAPQQDEQPPVAEAALSRWWRGIVDANRPPEARRFATIPDRRPDPALVVALQEVVGLREVFKAGSPIAVVVRARPEGIAFLAHSHPCCGDAPLVRLQDFRCDILLGHSSEIVNGPICSVHSASLPAVAAQTPTLAAISLLLEHDPEKVADFSDKIMRQNKELEQDE
jgi:hypothetical protein